MSSRLAPIGKRISASTQRYTFTFQPNSAEYNAQTVIAAGKISNISAPSGTTVYKSISTSPYQQQVSTGDSVDEGDILTVELGSAPTSKVTVEIVVSYSDVSVNVTEIERHNDTDRYLYDLCSDAHLVNVFDLSNHTKIASISLPSSSGQDYKSIVYRYKTKEVYVFDVSSNAEVTVIEGDPSNNNFNTIKQTFTISTILKTASYNVDDDLICGGDKSTYLILFDGSIIFNKDMRHTIENVRYFSNLGLYGLGEGSILDRNADHIGDGGKEIHDYWTSRNLFVSLRASGLRLILPSYNSNGRRFTPVIALSRGGNRTYRSIIFDEVNNKAFISGIKGRLVYMDLGNYDLTAFYDGEMATKESNIPLLYSSYSGYSYLQLQNNEIRRYDTSQSNPIDTLITSDTHGIVNFQAMTLNGLK